MQYSKLMLAAAVGALSVQTAGATPTAEEAAQLGKTLTPLGAIKAGNKEGTIPAWTGGVCKPPAGYKPHNGNKGGAPYVDPFADDQPLFKITAENLAQYADKLDEGTKVLMNRFPKTFYVNVYPTRRSACYPDWVYENTIKNVMRPQLVGCPTCSVTGAHAQYPFPIPKTGAEAVWNMILFFDRPLSKASRFTYYVDPSGGRSLIDVDWQYSSRPYWDNSLTMLPDDQPFNMVSGNKTFPAGLNGVGNLQHKFLRMDLKGDPTWSYTPGQRRVRLSPESAYDGVAPSAGGTFLFDEGSAFSGRMNKFDFQLLGRKEMYIPYNNSEQKLNYRPEVAMPGHLDPAAVRWELHRVWVVQAELRPGERHVQKRKMIYIDEDSWMQAIYHGIDHAGKVHHHYYYLTAQLYDKPGLGMLTWAGYDLMKGAYTQWAFTGKAGGNTSYGAHRADNVPASEFTPDGMAGKGIR